MKSGILKALFALLLIASLTLLTGCASEDTFPEDQFQVIFVDYDGTVLKTIDCIQSEVCEITPPEEPDNKENSYFTRWSVFPEHFSEIDRTTTIKAIYTLDNRVITIFGRSVVFYSFFIMMGIVVALIMAVRETKRHGMKSDDFIDGFLWIVPVAILGARLWYVIFEWSEFTGGGFFPSLLRMIGFQSGRLDFSTFGLSGLAIHGAFVTALICAFFYVRKRKIDLYAILDIVAIGFILAQAFGRWGNFFNQEAHGYVVGGMNDGTAVLSLEEQYRFLRYTLHLPEFIVNNMYIPRGFHSLAVEPVTGFYHPTFFYESSLNLVGFSIMLVLRRIRKVRVGDLLSFYLIWYGGVRIFIETMRTDPLTFELFGITFKSAIVTSVLMILGGILFSVFLRIKKNHKTYGDVDGHFGWVKPETES
jgi:phosphatidylglycerol:prolipoprotein diacylglycerol transferase